MKNYLRCSFYWIRYLGFILFTLLLFSYKVQATPIWTGSITGYGSVDQIQPFTYPSGVAFAKNGNLLIVDSSTKAVQVFDDLGTYLGQFGDNKLSHPYGIAVAESGNIFVTNPMEANSQNLYDSVHIFNSTGTWLSSLKGNSDNPHGIAVYGSGNQEILAICDGGADLTGVLNNFIQLFDSQGRIISTFGQTGSGNSEFKNPLGLTFSNDGSQLLVSDTNNNTVKLFNSSVSAGNPYLGQLEGFTPLNSPKGIAVASNGNILVTDSPTHSVKVFKSSGEYLTDFGNSGSNESQLNGPISIAANKNGRILIGDAGTKQIQMFFDPALWTSASTNNFLHFPLDQNLTLNTGYVLNVKEDTILTNGITLALNDGSNFKTDILTITNGANLSLSNGSTFTFNALTLDGGNLINNSNYSFIDAPVNITGNNGFITVNAGNSAGNLLDLRNDVTGSGKIIKQGTGDLIIEGPTDLGGLTVNEGTVRLTYSTKKITDLTGSGNLVLLVNLQLGGNNSTTYSGNISGNGALIKQGNSTLTLSGTNNNFGPLVINQGTVNLVGSTQNAIQTMKGLEGTGILVLTGVSANVVMDNNSTFSGLMTGNGGLIKQGGGVLTLTNANNFGPLTINAGSVNFTNNTQTITDLNGSSEGSLVLTNVLKVGSSNNSTFSGLISGTGTLIKQGSGTLNLAGANDFGSLSINSGTVNLTASAQKVSNLSGIGTLTLTDVALTLENGGTNTFSGIISGSGSLIKQGIGTLNLSGANQFGALFLKEGIVSVTGSAQIITEFSGNETTQLILGSNLTLGNANSTTYRGIIFGTNGLVKQGSGTLTLTGANQFSSLTISEGVVNLMTSPQTLSMLNGTGDLVLNDINLTLGNNSNNTFNGRILGTGGLIKQGSGTLNLSGTNQFGSLVINEGAVKFNTDGTLINLSGSGNLNLARVNLTVESSNNLTFRGTILGNGNLIKQGSGTLTLSGANQFSSLVINEGTVNLDTNTQTILDLSGGGNLCLTGNTLTVGSSHDSTFTGMITGNGNLIKQGSGNLILEGTNDFSALTINEGKLTLKANAQNVTTLSGQGYLELLESKLTVKNAVDNVFNGTIAGTGSLEKQGTGMLTLAGLINITDLTVNGGKLKIPSTGNFEGNVVIQDESDLEISGGILKGSISGSGNSTLTISGNFTPTAAITTVKNIDLTTGVFNVGQIISGTTDFTVSSGSTVNINKGGTLSGNMSGLGTLNVYTDYTTPGTLSIGSINVKSGGITTLTTLATVTNLFKVEAGGSLYLNEDVAGKLMNEGTLIHKGQVPRTISGDFIQSGTLKVDFSNVNRFSSLQVDGHATLNGGTLAINIPGSNLSILNANTFDVITSSNPLHVSSLPTLTFPSSLLLSFNQAIDGNALRITAVRKSLKDINTIPELEDMCRVLDDLFGSTTSSDVISALDSQTTIEGLEQALYQLAPPGMNQSIVETSFHNLPFDFIEHRLGMLRNGIDALQFAHHTFSAKSGYAAGDMLEGNGSYGPMVFGSTKKQNERQDFSGYKAFTAGFGFLGDAPVSDYARLGAALSYTGSSIKQDDAIGNTTFINNVQATIYGSTNYGPLFLDGLFSAGFNNYHGKRNIAIINQTATSSYNAVQYSGKLRGGFSIPFYDLEASPLASVQYTHLSQQGYTEKGANGANLTLNALKVDALEIGIGGSIADLSYAEDVLPEIHALYLYYTKPPKLQMTAEFAEGSPAFVANGIRPARAGVNVGGSITMMLTDELFVVGSYDLESKQDSVSHALACKVKWLF